MSFHLEGLAGLTHVKEANKQILGSHLYKYNDFTTRQECEELVDAK